MTRTRTPSLFAVVAVVGALALPGAAAQATQHSASPRSERYIVVLKDSTARPDTVAREQAASLGGTVGHVYAHALKGYSVALPPSRLATLRLDPRVEYVVVDASGDPTQGKPSPSPAPSPAPQSVPTGVDRVDGTSPYARASVGVDADIAVLDTGIAPHTELNVVGGYWCGGRSTSGWNTDATGHGTHVAGTAAARNNDVGVVGTAPGARLWSVRVPNKQGIWYMSAALCAVDWVAAFPRDADGTSGIEVANASWGWEPGRVGYPGAPGPSDASCGNAQNDPLHTAVCRLVTMGTGFVAAAGNSASDAHALVPAGYEESITVSALADFDGRPGGLFTPASPCYADQDDTFANFSSFGPDVDLIAPGVCITSTAPGGGYAVKSGTSMAVPHVVGAAALHLSKYPLVTPSGVKAAMLSSGDPAATDGDPDGIAEPLLNLATLASR